MATRKVKFCDRCEKQTPDENIISGSVFSHRQWVGPESEDFHIYFDLCADCAEPAVKELIKMCPHEKVLEWVKKWAPKRRSQ